MAAIDLGWESGKRKRIWFYGATQKEVRDKLAEARRKQQAGLPVAVEKVLLEQFLERWLTDVAQPNTRPKTFDQYTYAVHRHLVLVPVLGKVNGMRWKT